MVPVVKTWTTVPVVVSTSAVASRTSTPVIFFDLPLERLGVVCEQLPVELSYLRSAGGTIGQDFLSRRECLVQCDDQRVVAQNDRHRLGQMARSLFLERTRCPGDLLCHGRFGRLHPVSPWRLRPPNLPPCEKKTDVAKPP
jgi:hypothetical protein